MKHPLHPLHALALAAGLGMAQGAEAQAVVELQPGSAHEIETAGPIEKVVIDQAGVVAARLRDRRHLELTGVAPGQTPLRLELSPTGGDAYLVKVGRSGQQAARNLQESLRAQPGFEAVEVSPAADGVVLSGHVKDIETHARLTELAKAEAGGPVTDLVGVTGGQMVAVDISFYAVDANTLKELGMNFSYLGGNIQGGVFSPSSLQSFSLTPSALSVGQAAPLQDAFNLLLANPKNGAMGVLSALSNAGLSQVLAKPTLLVRSGQQAEFMAGGDVPVPAPQGGSTAGAIAIEYHPYGVRLSVSPVVLSDRRILLTLSPEVSELDYTDGVQIQGTRVPAFRRRSASTTVELGDRESFIIAGLTYMTGSSVDDRVPGLANLPVLGQLFKTSQATHERQELIVVATPRLIAPLDHDPLEGVKIDGEAALDLQRVGLAR